MIFVRKVTKLQLWAHEAQKDKPKKEAVKLPNRYQAYEDIFNEEKAEQFLPVQEEDMNIKFKPGALAVINYKVYPLNKKETNILWEFLNEEERKGYIKAGSLQYTSPVFFVGKKDSQELRPVIDYREINKWTVQDNNPLPNINTALENLKGGRLFSKFDLQWGSVVLRSWPHFSFLFGLPPCYVTSITLFLVLTTF